MRTLILLLAMAPALTHAATYFDMRITRDPESCGLGGGSPVEVERQDLSKERGVAGALRFENKDAGISGVLHFPQWEKKDSGWELKEKHVREITFESKEGGGAAKSYGLRVEKGGIYKVTVSGGDSSFTFNPKDSAALAGTEAKELKGLFATLIESLMPALLVYESGHDVGLAKVCGAPVDHAVVSSRLRKLTDWIQARTAVKKAGAPRFNGGQSPAVN